MSELRGVGYVAVVLLGSGDYDLSEAHAGAQSGHQINGNLRSILGGRDYKARVFEQVHRRVIETRMLRTRHRVRSNKNNALFVEYRRAISHYIAFDAAYIHYDRTLAEFVGVLFYKVNDSHGIKRYYRKVSLAEPVLGYLLVDSALFESLAHRFGIGVDTHYMMKSVRLESLADRTAYKPKTYYRYIHLKFLSLNNIIPCYYNTFGKILQGIYWIFLQFPNNFSYFNGA